MRVAVPSLANNAILSYPYRAISSSSQLGTAKTTDTRGEVVKIALTKGRFNSIEAPFSWQDIPKLAIVTGENGTGKSHLLQMMFRELLQGSQERHNVPGRVFTYEGDPLAPWQVVLQTSEIQLSQSQAGIAELQEQSQQTLGLLRSKRAAQLFDPNNDQTFLRANQRDLLSERMRVDLAGC